MEFWFARKHLLWVLINLIFLSGYESCLEKERLGLLRIRDYFESSGVRTELVLPSWTDNLASNCCSWERVKCNSTTGRVIELFLNNTKLQPEVFYGDERIWFLNVSLFLPFEELHNLDLHLNGFSDCYQNHELRAIEHLETLDLSYNNLSDFSMVQDFKPLKNLITLNLEYNSFNSSILPFVSTLTSLRTLNLGSNHLNLGASISLTEIASLENLEQLDLSANSLKNLEGIVDSLSRLQKLEVLNLEGNSITKSNLKSLGAVTSLKNLNLAYCRLDGVLLAQDLFADLVSLKNLQILDLSENNLNGSLKDFASLKNLQILDLSENNLNGSLKDLASLENLQILDLSYNLLSGSQAILADLTSLKNLQILHLSGNNLNGSFRDFVSLKNLQILDLSGNSLTMLTDLSHMTSLKVLSVADNNLNGPLALKGLCAPKDLQELDLSNNNLTGIVPSCLSKLTSLKFLDLSSNKLEGDISLFPIVALRSLKYLDLTNNLFCGQFSFYSIANHTNLEVLMLSSNNPKLEVQTQYPHDWLPTIQLKVIIMSNCRLNNIPQFFAHQIDLRIIDLSHNNLTGTFPNWLLENNTQLELLSLRNNFFVGSFHLSSNSSFGIKYMDISNNHFHGKIQQNIGGIIGDVKIFNLSTNTFDGAIPLSIGSMPYLVCLDLSNNKFLGEVPLTNSTNLKFLILSNNRLSGSAKDNVQSNFIDVLTSRWKSI